jgi:hypothetical protein
VLTLEDLDRLRRMDPVDLDGSTVPDFDLYLHNNLREESRKGKRTELQVRSDTAKGIGFEHVLLEHLDPPIFQQAAPAMENARDLRYSLRMKDFLYRERPVQVKTITRLHGSYAYLGESMLASIMKCFQFNDFFVFGISEPLGDRNEGSSLFRHRPAFAISTSTLRLSIRTQDGSYINLDGLSRRPDHFQPICRELLDEDD